MSARGKTKGRVAALQHKIRNLEVRLAEAEDTLQYERDTHVLVDRLRRRFLRRERRAHNHTKAELARAWRRNRKLLAPRKRPPKPVYNAWAPRDQDHHELRKLDAADANALASQEAAVLVSADMSVCRELEDVTGAGLLPW